MSGTDVASPALCLRRTSSRGLGVFALRGFARGELIERAPVLVLPDPEWQLLNQTTLQHYYYSWNAESAAIAFGFGSFYNHSATPNAQFLRRFAEQVMEYVAVMDIEAGEEITITYGCPLWFEPA